MLGTLCSSGGSMASPLPIPRQAGERTATTPPSLSPARSALGGPCCHTPGRGGGRAETTPLPSTLLQSSSNFITGIQKQSKTTPTAGTAQWAGEERANTVPQPSPCSQLAPMAPGGAAASTAFPAPPGHHWPSKTNQHALQISWWDVSHLLPSPLPPQNSSG